jgi:SAM-dependent methyltransferase
MNTSTARRLIRLNRAFYDQFAAEFAATRAALSPGMRRALGTLHECRSLLDLGCGDGRVGRYLAAGRVPNRVTCYRGVDGSQRLLDQFATGASRPLPRDFVCTQADMASANWHRHPALGTRPFEAAVCFAALFHVPGPRRRLRLLRAMHSRLVPEGRAAVSVWQFLHVPRIRRKVVPWKTIGLTADQVDRGDLLLDWRRGGCGWRYVHHFEPAELEELCHRAGFSVVESYRSDGATGDMSLFLILRRR